MGRGRERQTADWMLETVECFRLRLTLQGRWSVRCLHLRQWFADVDDQDDTDPHNETAKLHHHDSLVRPSTLHSSSALYLVGLPHCPTLVVHAMSHQANMNTPWPDNGQTDGNQSAPWYQVPSSSKLVSLDHPAIIQNLHKAVRTLGGPEKLNHVSHLTRW